MSNKDYDNIVIPDNEANAIKAVMDKFSKDPAHDAPLILEIVEILKKADIPELGKKEMLNFFQGTYFELLGRAAIKSFKKIQEFKKSLKYFSGDKEIKRVKSEIIQAEMSLLHEKGKHLPANLLEAKMLELSQVVNDTANDKEKNKIIGMMLMYRALSLLGRPESLEILKQSEETLEKSDFLEGVHKIRAMRFSLESHYQTNPFDALEFMKKAVAETEKTEDKYGLERELADMHFLQGFVATGARQRADEYEKAGHMYLKSGQEFYKTGHGFLAKAYFIKSHDPEISVDNVIKYEKLSSEAFKKAGSERDYHNMRGAYYGMMSIKQMLKDGSKQFLHFCSLALKEFDKAGNRSEADFFFGVLSMGYAAYLPNQKKLEALEIASNLLERRGQGLFAKYQLYRLKINNEPDITKQAELKKLAIECLGQFIIKTEQDNARPKIRPELQKVLEDAKKLLFICKSEKYQLEAQLDNDISGKKQKYSLAAKVLEDLKQNYPDSQLVADRGLGWLYIEMEDFDKATEKFAACSKYDPKNKQIVSELEYSRELLKSNFRKLKEEKQLKETFLKQAFGGVLWQDDRLFYGEFIPKVLRTITRRGFLFEESPATYNKKTEPELRDEILSDLNFIFNNDATAESKIGDGKTDIRLKNPFSPYDKAIGECKWWSGQKQYVGAKEQLFSYLPPRQEYGIMITFSKEQDFNALLEKAKQATVSMADYIGDSIKEFNIIPGKKFSFISRHKFSKGGEVEIYHLFFNLFSTK